MLLGLTVKTEGPHRCGLGLCFLSLLAEAPTPFCSMSMFHVQPCGSKSGTPQVGLVLVEGVPNLPQPLLDTAAPTTGPKAAGL